MIHCGLFVLAAELLTHRPAISTCIYLPFPHPSSADAVDSPSTGRSAAELQRHAGVLHRGASDLAQLLDARGWPHDPRLPEVQVSALQIISVLIFSFHQLSSLVKKMQKKKRFFIVHVNINKKNI